MLLEARLNASGQRKTTRDGHGGAKVYGASIKCSNVSLIWNQKLNDNVLQVQLLNRDPELGSFLIDRQ